MARSLYSGENSGSGVRRFVLRCRLGVLAVVAAALAGPSAAAAQGGSLSPLTPGSSFGAPALAPSAGPQFVPHELIVRFAPSASAAEERAIRNALDASLEQRLPLAGMQLLRLPRLVGVREAVKALERRPDVAYAEPNFLRELAVTPNDPLFSPHLWGLHNTGQSVNGTAGTADADIDAPEAWDLTTGSKAVATAIVDTGVRYTHEDLSANIWANPGEIGGGKETNGIDDDGNGFVDDFRGWDFTGNDNAPNDSNGHGTHVAGTIGAVGNNSTGVTGVNWQTGLMPLRVQSSNPNFLSTAHIISAFGYAGNNGARVVNGSFGSSSFSQAEYDAITNWPNTLFAIAAGNDSANNEVSPEYPCNYPAKNLICVAATDQDDDLASFSNYGATSVDLAAPGVTIASTYPANTYVYLSGTSMATPHVAGVAAQLWARAPNASMVAVRNAILQNVDAKASLSGMVATGGRLNAFKALNAIDTTASDTQPPNTTIDSGPSGSTTDASPSFQFSSTEASSTFECRLDSGLWETCTSPKQYSSLSQGSHTFKVRAIDPAGNTDMTPASSTFSVDTSDTTPPSAPTITDTDPDSPANDNNPEVKGSAEAGSTVKIYANSTCTGTPIGSGSAANFNGATGITAAVPSDQTTALRATATDAAGNASACSSAFAYTEDSTAPAAPNIISGPSGPTNDNDPSFGFGGEGGASFQCRLDSSLESAFAACSSPKPYTDLPDGPHTFEVRARDAAGNTGPAASRSFTVDTNAPGAPTISSGPSETTNADDHSFGFTGESGASFQCRLDASLESAFVACSSPKSYTDLADGPHTFEVRARDAAGNTGPAVLRNWTIDPNAGSQTTSGAASPGGTVTTDPAGTGPTGSTPMTTAVTTPNGGEVTITHTTSPTQTEPSGYSFLGQEVQISAPSASPANPLQLVFTIDSSAIPAGTDPSTVAVFRNGAPAGECPGSTTASPDPCVKNRAMLGSGDLELTVLASQASAWNFGRPSSTGGSGISGDGSSSGEIGGEGAVGGATMGGDTAAPTPGTSSPPPRCVVPKLKGKRLRAARRMLKRAHCTLGQVRRKRSRKQAGLVLSQRPRPGAVRPAGAKVRLVVSKR